MCPDCVFIFDENVDYYTTWNTDSETPTTITNYSNDYHDVITNRNIFVGVILDGDKAERVFACSTIDGNPFCLEGTSNGLSNNQKQQYMQRIMGEMADSTAYGNEWINDDLTVSVLYDGRFGTCSS